MGEKIKDLSKGILHNRTLNIELNQSNNSDKDELIHIQSDIYRIEMKKKDYIHYALSILLAEKNLKKIKDIK